MSITFIDLVGRNSGFNSSENAVLFCLAWHSSEDGVSWPGITRIHEWTGLSPATIRPTLHRLEGYGCMTREWRGGRSTKYRLHSQAIKEFTPTRSSTPKSVTPTRSMRAPLTDQVGSPLPDLVPEPSVEQSIEPSVYTAAFAALAQIEGYTLPRQERANIQRWLANHETPPDKAETTAASMAAKLEYRDGRWHYGKKSRYKSIPLTYYDWILRPPPVQPSLSANGRRQSEADFITAEQVLEGQEKDRRRPPPAKVNS